MENAAVQERAQAPHMLTGAQRFYIGVKRAADVALSLLGLVLLSPVLLAIGIAIVLDDGFPVLFTQRRVGRGKRPFHILKFRTMRAIPPMTSLPICWSIRSSTSPGWERSCGKPHWMSCRSS